MNSNVYPGLWQLNDNTNAYVCVCIDDINGCEFVVLSHAGGIFIIAIHWWKIDSFTGRGIMYGLLGGTRN